MRVALVALLLSACCPLGYHYDLSGDCVENGRSKPDGGKSTGPRLVMRPTPVCARGRS